ncbi:unnamed protein product [Citrullus colocynthis]|uniref:Uncharacterized protein n=1 Tax=Citrullus colocynthis TaxID=252529 RepID=A0ABP0XRG8_9ROSI
MDLILPFWMLYVCMRYCGLYNSLECETHPFLPKSWMRSWNGGDEYWTDFKLVWAMCGTLYWNVGYGNMRHTGDWILGS